MTREAMTDAATMNEPMIIAFGTGAVTFAKGGGSLSTEPEIASAELRPARTVVEHVSSAETFPTHAETLAAAQAAAEE